MSLTEGCVTDLCVTVCLSPQSTVTPPSSTPPGGLDAINLQLSYSLSVIFKPISGLRVQQLADTNVIG